MVKIKVSPILNRIYLCIFVCLVVVIVVFGFYRVFLNKLYSFPNPKNIVSIIKMTDTLSIIKDSNNNIFFRTDTNPECGYLYFYENSTAYIFDKSKYPKYAIPLNSLIDIKSIRYKTSESIFDILEDNKYNYRISNHMCTHQIHVTIKEVTNE